MTAISAVKALYILYLEFSKRSCSHTPSVQHTNTRFAHGHTWTEKQGVQWVILDMRIRLTCWDIESQYQQCLWVMSHEQFYTILWFWLRILRICVHIPQTASKLRSICSQSTWSPSSTQLVPDIPQRQLQLKIRQLWHGRRAK